MTPLEVELVAAGAGAAFVAGVVAGVLLASELARYGLTHSHKVRDKLRDVLARVDGYPFIRCPYCEHFVSTAPPDDDDDDED